MTQSIGYDRYLLIYMDKYVRGYSLLYLAESYAKENCRGKNKFYVIVDVEKKKIVSKWSY